jgi:hypothetical protein
MVRSYLTHNLSNATYMQIVRSNNNRRPRTNISCKCKFPFYSIG